MSNIIQLLINSINEYDTDQLTGLLETLPIEELTIDRSNNLLLTLMENVYTQNRDEMVGIILKRWSESMVLAESIEGEYYPIIIKMLMTNLFPDEMIAYILRVTKMGIIEILTDLIDEDKNDQLVFAINRVIDMYEIPNIDVIEYLKKTANEKENDVYVFAMDRIIQQKGLTDYVEKPKWVYTPKILEKESSLINNLPNEKIKNPKDIEDAVRILTEGLYDLGLTTEAIDESKEILTDNLTKLSKEEEYDKIEDFIKPSLVSNAREVFITDPQIFTVLGAVNSQALSDLSPNTICFKYGGCRMYYCNCFTYDEDQDDQFQAEIPAWFTGFCQVCNRQIKKRTYALRRPGLSGGWHGCYCSYECVQSDLTNLVDKQIMNQVLNDLDEYGVLDRIEDLGNIETLTTDNGY